MPSGIQLAANDIVQSAAEISGYVRKIVECGHFCDSPQLAAFLSYVVGETLKGKPENIKGYSIALEALGRDEKFDPQLDPIVRVQATRLRKALNSYYEEEGVSDRIEISMEPGSYVPRFFERTVSAGTSGPKYAEPGLFVQKGTRAQSPDSARSDKKRSDKNFIAKPSANWRKYVVIAALASGLTAMATFTYRAFFGLPSGFGRVESGLTHPTLFMEAHPANSPAQMALLGDLKGALSQFDDLIMVLESGPPSGSTQSAAPLSYELVIRFPETEAKYPKIADPKISFRLVHIASKAVIWAKEFTAFPEDKTSSDQRSRVVRVVVTEIAQPYGAVFAHARKIVGNQVPTDASYACQIRSFDYWRNYNAVNYAKVMSCLDDALVQNPSNSSLYASRAYFLVEGYRRYNLNLDRKQLDEALESAKKSIELGPFSARAHQSLMGVHAIRHEFKEAFEAGRHALDLNPYDTDIAADLGSRYIQIGDLEQGRPLLESSIALNPAPPVWYYFILFLDGFISKDRLKMSRAAQNLQNSEFPLAFVALAIDAKQKGNEMAARQAIERLCIIIPEFRADPVAFLDRTGTADWIVRDLVRALPQPFNQLPQ